MFDLMGTELSELLPALVGDLSFGIDQPLPHGFGAVRRIAVLRSVVFLGV